MPDRLSPLDVSFLYLESETTPMHIGGMCLFRPPASGFDVDRLVRLVTSRLGLVPRFRQKVRWVPGRIGNPVWVDDADFDVSYHVRRAALPRPGTREQLLELVARIQSRPLDRSRPLWELYVVEGLADGDVAVVTKTHHAMVDGIAAVDIAALILDPSPEPRETPAEEWRPTSEPSAAELVADALTTWLRKPREIVNVARGDALGVRRFAERAAGTLGGLTSALRSTARSASPSPLNVEIGAQRRFATTRARLADYKQVRRAHGGTVNDVVLATVAGALRAWMLTRGESVSNVTMRAMVPVSVRARSPQGALGNRISSYFVDLPVGEPDPVARLKQISESMAEHKEAGQAVGADVLVAMAGFSPPTLHALGARLALGLTRRLFNLVVTNVPGPQVPLYATGAQMLEVYPVVPLTKGHAVGIGLTSYDGGVYYGLNADRDAMPDVDVLAQCIDSSLAELVGTA